MKYWLHPESDSYFTTKTEAEGIEMFNSLDGSLSVELSQAEYEKRQAVAEVPEVKGQIIEKDWRKARERRMMSVSASQLETFELCERKWWLSKVRKLTDATTKSQVFGTVVHGVIERYLLADDLGRVDCPCGFIGACLLCNGTGKKPVDLYPPGWQIAKGRFGEPSEGAIDPKQEDDVRRLIQAAIEGGVLERLPGRRVEANFNRQVMKTPCMKCEGKGECWTGKKCADCGGHGVRADATGEERQCGACGGTGDEFGKCPDCGGDGNGCTVMMVGFIDVEFYDQIQDHKTTKSMKYAKSPAKLAENTQMLIYAHEILEKAKERGESIPQKITLRHNQYCAPENKVRKTEVVVTREHVEQHWEKIKRNAVKMAEFRKIVNAWHEIHDPANPSQACNAYGGCAFRSVCSGQETEENYEKRIARQKELKYTGVVNGKQCGEAVDSDRPTIIKGTTTVANFNDRLAQLKARNASGGATAAGIPGSAPSINPPAETITAPHTVVASSPASLPPPASPATNAVIQTATAASAAHIAPPVAPVEVAGVGLVGPPPWAVPGCNACLGVGFSTKGAPCRICDMKQKVAGKPQSIDFHIENLGEGIVASMSKQNEDNMYYSFITGRPAEAVKVQAKEANAPTTTPPPAAPVVEAPPIGLAQASNLEIVGTIAAGIPPGASPLPTEALSPAQAAEAATKRKRRTKAEMEADAMREPISSNAPTVVMAGLGMVLVIGAIATKCPFEHCDFQDVFNNYANELSKANGAADYYDLDPFKRRDMLARTAGKIAEDIGNMYVFADPQTPDTKALLEALRPHASMVIVATK